jgi:ligand-binding sensor protein/sugar diacid utilization regulator/GAF domain-containing protein
MATERRGDVGRSGLTSAVSDAPASGTRWALTDLIDLERLQSIQDTFASVFNLPTVIIDTAGNNITEITHRVSFCEDLTRPTSEGVSQCRRCDRSAMADAAETGRPSTFRCWNGLVDTAIPIAPDGEVAGYFLCGQVLTGPPDLARFRGTAERIGADPDDYAAAVANVRIVERERYDASVQTMWVLADMIANQAAAGIDNYRTLVEATAARDEAAGLRREIDEVLDAFNDLGNVRDVDGTLSALTSHLSAIVRHEHATVYLVAGDVLVPRGPRQRDRDGAVPIGDPVLGRVALTGASAAMTTGGRARLAVPLRQGSGVAGVLQVTRTADAPFSDRERRLAEMLASQASVALRASGLFDELQERLRRERVVKEMNDALTSAMTVQEALSTILRTTLVLAGASHGMVEMPEQGGEVTRLADGMDAASAARVRRVLAEDVNVALTARRPVLSAVDGEQVLVVPLTGRPCGGGVVIAQAPTVDEDQLRQAGAALAVEGSVGLEGLWMRQREQQLSTRHRLMAELAADLLTSTDPEQVRGLVLTATTGIVGAEAVVIAMADDGLTTDLHVQGPQGRSTVKVELGRGARLAAASMRHPDANTETYGIWAQHVARAVERHCGQSTSLHVPITSGRRFVGTIVCATGEGVIGMEERHLLTIVGSAVSASLTRMRALHETDSSLRRRLEEVQAINSFAERTAAARTEGELVDELLLAFIDLGRLRGAGLVRSEDDRWVVGRAARLDPDARDQVERALARLDVPREGVAVHEGGVVVAGLTTNDPMALVGVGVDVVDPTRQESLTTLARHASAALENVRLREHRQRAISRLEDANERAAEHLAMLRRLLSLQDTLGKELLEPNGTEAVRLRLEQLLEAEVVLDQDLVDAATGEEPKAVEGLDRAVLHMPVRTGRRPGRLQARRDTPFSELDRAVLEQGALLMALGLLQERTAMEVETRLKGGFIEDLCSGAFTLSHIVQQARAMGIDLDQPHRVFMLQAAGEATPSPFELHMLQRATGSALREADVSSVVALWGGRVVGIVAADPADHDVPALLRQGAKRSRHEDANLAIGIRCTGPADYRESATSTERGLELMALRGQSGATFSFADEGIAQLLLRSSEPAALLAFITRWLQPLHTYYASHAVDLKETLVALYSADLNLQEAARRLHIHVSTLRYRLGKAADVLGVDPREGAARLEIELALRADEVLGVHGG